MKKIKKDYSDEIYILSIKDRSLILACLMFCKEKDFLDNNNKPIAEEIIKILNQY